MTNEWAPAPPPKAPRKWPKRLLWVGCMLFALSLAGYFLVTSSFFFKSVILPRVNAALGTDISVDSASLSPWRSVTLEGMQIRTSRSEDPVIQIPELRIRYSFWRLLGGNVRVFKLFLDSPTVTLIEYADGRRNIDSLLRIARNSSSSPRMSASEDGEPLQLQLDQILVTNVNLRLIRHHAGGGRDQVTLSKASLAVSGLANGRTLVLRVGADLRLDQVPAPSNLRHSPTVMRATSTATFQCRLSKSLELQSISGQAMLDMVEVPPSLPELANLRAILDADLTLNRIKELQLAFARGSNVLGNVGLRGNFSMLEREGDLLLEVTGLDRHALNLAGAPFGLRFGDTTLNMTNSLALSHGGREIQLNGKLHGNKISVQYDGKSTLPVDVRLEYDAEVNQEHELATLNAFHLQGSQSNSPILKGTLSNPMSLRWSENASLLGDSIFRLVVTNVNLADWRAFLGDYQGQMHADVEVKSAGNGQEIVLTLDSFVEKMALTLSGNRLDNVQAQLQVQSRFEEFRQAKLSNCRFSVEHGLKRVLEAGLSGTMDIQTKETSASAFVLLDLPAVLAMTPVPELAADEGELSFSVSVQQHKLAPAQTNKGLYGCSLLGSFSITNFTGKYGSWVFEDLSSKSEFKGEFDAEQVHLSDWRSSLLQGTNLAAMLNLSGHYELTNRAAQVSLQITNCNEFILRSFAPTNMEGSVLNSIRLDIDSEGSYRPKGLSELDTKIRLSELRLQNPSSPSPEDPIASQLNLKAVLEEGIAEVSELSGRFEAGDQQAGQLFGSAKWDTSNRLGSATLNVKDLDHHFLRPLMAPVLKQKSLETAKVGLIWKADYDASGESSMEGNIQLSDWLVADPAGGWPTQAMTLGTTISASLVDGKLAMRLKDGDLRVGLYNGGRFSGKADHDLESASGEGELQLDQVNARLLGPFFAPYLGGRELVSLSIDSNVSASWDPQNDNRLIGNLSASEFLIRDPATNVLAKPIDASLAVNVGLEESVILLDHIRLGLGPTVRARNEMIITGQLDFTDENATGGSLKIQAEALDLTPYYDFFVAMPSPHAAEDDESDQMMLPQENEISEPVSTEPLKKEPQPIVLPLRDFHIDGEIGKFFLREITVNDWKTALVLDQSRIALKPLSMNLNRAPFRLNMDADLSIPGFRYELVCQASHIPIGPLVNTLIPESHGIYQGDWIHDVHLKGAGITGGSLRSNLQGHVTMSLTNAVIAMSQKKVKALMLPVATLLRTPELMSSPLSWAGAEITVGNGRVQTLHAGAISPLFAAGTTGEAEIADDVLRTPYGGWPIELYLERDLARQARLVPRGASKEDTYVQLPKFVSLEGTLLEPDSKIDKSALATATSRRLLGSAMDNAKPVSGNNPFKLIR